MITRTAKTSPQTYARIGDLYLIIIVMVLVSFSSEANRGIRGYCATANIIASKSFGALALLAT
jgi:hypothetical protein